MRLTKKLFNSKSSDDNIRNLTLKILIYCFTLAVFLCFGFLLPVQASRVNDLKDNLTRLAVNAKANHEIKFQTVSGVSTSTDTIIIIFENGFNLADINFGDVDLFEGSPTGLETQKNLADTAGIDRWGFSKSGQTITLSPPTNTVLGEINANDFVVIRIGLNASAGMNQIVNPGIAGIYSISIAGGFGDTGNTYAPVIGNDRVTVSAEVLPVGAIPIVPDTAAPSVEKIFIKSITSNSAVVIWETNEFSTGILEYGLDTKYGLQKQDQDNLLLTHRFNLFPLIQDTVYHFRIRAKDFTKNETVTKDYIFKTLGVSNVINFKAHGFDKQILLEWQNPEMKNMAGVRIVRSTEKYLESPDQGLVIYEGPGVSFLDRDVENGKWYFYSIFVFDTTRQYSSGAISSAVSLAEREIAPPMPEEVSFKKYKEILAGLKFKDLEFRVANESLRIYPNNKNDIKVLSKSLLSVLLQQDKVIKKLKTIIAQVGDSSYLLKINNKKGKYQALISTPKEIGTYPIVVLVVVYEDGSKDTVRGNLIVEDYGVVKGLPKAKLGEAKAGWYSERVEGVEITLFAQAEEGGDNRGVETGSLPRSTYQDGAEGKWQVWNGAHYFQYNPQVTGESGEYGFMVPNGKYYLALNKDGYKESITPEFEVTDNVINWDLRLDRVMKKKWYKKIWFWIVIGLVIVLVGWLFRRKRRAKEEKRKEELKKIVI